MEVQDPDELIVSGAIALTLRVLSYAGLAPLRFERVSTGFRVSRSRVAMVISGICLTILRLPTVAVVFYDCSRVVEKKSMIISSKFAFLLFAADFLLTMTVTSVGVFTGKSRMRSLFRILKRLQEVNNIIGCENSSEPRVWKVWIVLCTIFGGYVFYILNLISAIINNGIEEYIGLILLFALHIEFSLVSLLIMLHMILLYTIFSTTKALNFLLHQYFQEYCLTPSTPNGIFSITNYLKNRYIKIVPLQTVKTKTKVALHRLGDVEKTDNTTRPSIPKCNGKLVVFKCFLSICNIIALLNIFEGILTILMVCGNVLKLFATIYYFVSLIMVAGDTLMSSLILLIQALLIVYHSINILMIIEPCHKLQQEMNKAFDQLRQMLCRQSRYSAIYKEMDSIMFLTLPLMSPLGIVTLNRSLLALIAGMGTTFISIVLQFRLNYYQ